MPELPEVEVLARYLRLRLKGQVIAGVSVRRARVIAPTPEHELSRALKGARFVSVERRAKYLVFTLRRQKNSLTLLGHLGMSGRMYVVPQDAAEPKHAAVVLALGREKLIYEDTRYFGRFTLDTRPLGYLGPEPLGKGFDPGEFAERLRRSSQAIKVKLLDQCLVAGVGNIYASEALFRAGISPRVPARKLKDVQIEQLWRAIREVLEEAIRFGSTVRMDWLGEGGHDRIFYYGTAENYSERLAVYDRAGEACARCQTPIRRIVQAGRSTYFCPACQRK